MSDWVNSDSQEAPAHHVWIVLVGLVFLGLFIHRFPPSCAVELASGGATGDE